MSSISLVENVSYRIQLNYPDPGGNPPANLRIFWTLKRNGQPVSGINFPSSSSFAYIPNHPSSILTNVVLNPSGSANISLQEGDELSVRVEARNAISSVPVFLEASAIIVRLFPNVILEPTTLRKQNEPNVILPLNLLFDTDNDLTGTVLFLGGPTPQQTSPVTEWENESLFPREYIWIRGNDVVGTGPTYTIVEEDKDSFLSVQLTVRNGNSSARRTGFLVVGNPSEDNGFTDLTQFIASDSRIVYIAANGNDAAAAQAKGRGYYLPGDPEIGADPTQPVGTIQAYATIASARSALRDATSESFEGEPEWMLFRRGDSFSIGALIGRRTSGRSASERRVIGAYGNQSLPRPIVQCITTAPAMQSWVGGGNYAVASLDFRGSTARNIFNFMYGAKNILLEDLVFGVTGTNTIQSESRDIVIRRCVVSGNFSASSHVQGIFASDVQGDLVIEECVFDMNGYKQDPFDPSTWTFRVGGQGGLPAGEGVQPSRTFYDRNLYMSRYESLYLRGNIISRGGGGGSVQMRVGGIAERNALLFNNAAMSTGHPQANRSLLQDAVLQSNLVLHDDHMLPTGGFGQGIGLGVGEQEQGIASDNVVAHFHRLGNSGYLFSANGIGLYQDRLPERALSVTLAGNVGIDDFNPGIRLASTVSASGIQSAVIGDNAIAVASQDAVLGDDPTRAATVEFGTAASGGNDYFALTWNFAAWQASGYDPESTRHSTVGALAAAKGWLTTPDAQGRRGWERDIVSYMQSIDPTYIVNENVTVDDGVPTERRRSNAPRVWEVMSDASYYRDTMSNFWNQRVMSEAQAKLTARRYHAFLTFIERAKANRKGAWDPRYTADALNNYIREGFGKSRVSGPYTANYP